MRLKPLLLLAGLLSICWFSQAQTTPGGTNASQDTTHRMGFRHHRPFNGGDSTHNKDDWGGNFRRGPGQDQAMNGFHRGGPGGWDRTGRGQGPHRGFGERGFGRHGGFGRRDGHGMGREGWVHYSPEQRKQLEAISKEYRQKQRDLYKNDKMTLGEYKSQLVTLGKEKKAKMQALLTPEQKDRMAKMKQQAVENAQVRAAANLERMKIKLNLSDEQTATIKSQQAKLRDQFTSIRENDNLLPQQKMEQIKALAMKRQDLVKSVLTPEQLSKFQAMHARHWGEGAPGQGGPGQHSWQN